MTDARKRYDEYWEARGGGRRGERTRRRSIERARLAAELLGPAIPGKARLLDVGCGRGEALACFAERGFAACGIDVSPRACAEARARGFEASCVDMERDDAPPGPFDAIVVLEVLEHLVDPEAAVGRILARLAPGGSLVLSLPNEFHAVRRISILAGREPFGGHDDPHVRHFGRRSVRRFAAACGLRIVASRVTSIVPPGWGILSGAGRVLARALPRLFALSFVLRTRRETDAA